MEIDTSNEPLALLVDSGHHKEQVYQQFFEDHPNYLLIDELMLNHGLHFNCIISQFSIDTSLICDFAFITKSSLVWRLVLVEIELPHSNLLNKSSIPHPSKNMVKGMAQIDSWRAHMETGLEQVRERLKPLLKPLVANPLEVFYVLVTGQDTRLLNDSAKAWLRLQQRDGFKIYTFKTLSRSYALRKCRQLPVNVLRLDGKAFRYLKLNTLPDVHLNYALNDELKLTVDQKVMLTQCGYNFSAWESGDRILPYGQNPDQYAFKSC